MEKIIFWANWYEKEYNTYIRQNRLQNKSLKKDKEGHYIIFKGVVNQEDITLVNIYAPNIGAPKYIRKILEASRRISTATHS